MAGVPVKGTEASEMSTSSPCMTRSWPRVRGASGALLVASFAVACQRSPRQPLANSSVPVAVASPSTAVPPTPVSAAPLVPPTPPAPLCGDPSKPPSAFVFVSPEHPVRGQPVHVVALTDEPLDASLTVQGSPSTTPTTVHDREGGPPYHWLAQVDAPAAGKWQATLTRDGACGGGDVATLAFTVGRHSPKPPETPRTSLWMQRAAWTPALEDLYSAWIERMFDAPLDAQPSWNALHEVLRDRSRNFLFDHLDAAEDEQNVPVRPDCADLPYFLRAYFAFKLGLPFGWSHCSRGENGTPPTCTDFASSSDPFPSKDPVAGAAPPPNLDQAPAKQEARRPVPVLPAWADPDREREGPWEVNVKRLGEFFRTTLADAAQSGAGRTPADDETGDYYPIRLSQETLRPGTIFADPYGHVLVVAKRIAQTPTSGGVLLAVDGQPDGTVARKRFWRGNFLFAVDPALGSAGFKRFRPVVRDSRPTSGPNGIKKMRHLGNAELADFSPTDQYTGGVEGFYDKMDDVLSPAPLDPTQALLETVQALEEQVKTRVVSVENGRRFLEAGKDAAEMPDGAKIFETTGEWEDFSTPSRDLRLLIAIDVAKGLPSRIARRPERYAMPSGTTPEQVRASLEARLATELRTRTFEYKRSDGSSWKLTLEQVAERQAALEMAYNPNDCVEARWGAPEGSDEASTCHAHAPVPQVAKMQSYRAWFHERRRPPR